MDGESWLIILLIMGALAVLFWLYSKRSPKVKTPPVPTAAKPAPPVVRSPATKAPTTTPTTHYPQNVPQPDPVIPIFEDRVVRQVRRCPSCDGENPIHARSCEICGRRL